MRKGWILFVLGILLLLPVNSFAAYEISDGSVKGLYHLDDTVDSSGNGYNLTNNGSASFVAGKLSNALALNGSSQNFSNGTANRFVSGYSSPFTLSFWLYFNDVNTSNAVIVAQDASDYSGFEVRYRYNVGGDGHKRIFLDQSATGNLIVGSYQDSFVDATWYHVVFTYDGSGATSGVKIYVNGSLVNNDVSSGSFSGAYSSTYFSVGKSNASGDSRWFGGHFDELVMFNSVISTSTIAALYNSGSGVEVCTAVDCGSSSTSTPSGILYPIMSTSTDALIGNFFHIWIFLTIAAVVLLVAYGLYRFLRK